MKRRLLFMLVFWLCLVLTMALLKLVFGLVEPAYTLADLAAVFKAVGHGLTMDMAMAAYLTVLVWIWIFVSIWVRNEVMSRILKIWIWITASLIALAWCADALLYPYWGFKLDTTPLFYLFTWPASAMASTPWWYIPLGIIVIAVLASLIAWPLLVLRRKILPHLSKPKPVAASLWMILCGALLFLAIRGGVTVSTMSPARGYFSSDMRLNHVAVNPLFNFVYSAMHVNNISDAFRYTSDEEAAANLNKAFSGTTDSIPEISLTVEKPDIYLVIMESFSAHLMPSLGGKPIAVKLDSIARSGLSFSNFYAESFRTDRALPVILSGYPALPSAPAMKFPEKFGNLPSLAKSLNAAGYDSRYFYGGDIDFTNLRAYLLATGFRHITSDKDFSLSTRLSKWGAPDHELFRAALVDAKHSDRQPVFRVIQTSSSHEPFEVPDFRRYADDRTNAFAYADSCLGAFVDSLRTLPSWNRSLVVIVPDHWGALPQGLAEIRERHHVPLVMTGGALQGVPALVKATGSQSAIAPTILALLGLPYDNFYLGRNLLDPNSPHYAWLTEKDEMMLITDRGNALVPVTETESNAALGNPDLATGARGFVQLLYRDFDRR